MIAKKIAEKAALMSSSFLFHGIKGTGKKYTALNVAKLLLCETKSACNKCNECNRINKNIHPNVIIIEPENKDIKIESIRGVINDLIFSPAEGRKRFIIINEAHRLNQSSANALLKTLEEPPADTVFMLLSSNLHRMLPTIISRCEIIRFTPMTESKIASILEISEHNLLLQYSMGSVSRTSFYLNNEPVISKLIAFVNRPIDNYSIIAELCKELVEICEKDFEVLEYVISLILYVQTKKAEEMIANGYETNTLFSCIKNVKEISNKVYYNTSPLIVFENMLLGLT